MLKAVVYDFDGTLTPETYPEFAILEKCGMQDGARNPAFFATAWKMTEEKNIDIYEAMARVILDIMKQANMSLTDENITLGATKRIFNPGVESFLAKLQKQGVANFLLSSGLQAYLKRLKIAPKFAEIYASVFSYNQHNEVNGIKRVMSADEKAVVLQEIALRINGRKNDFSGIIYIGDGPTDVVAMEHIKRYGGRAILIRHDICDPNLPIIDDSKVDLVADADFTEGGKLAKYVNSQL